MNREGFRKELQSAINRNSMENGSNTPDFILADFLVGCLDAFDKAVAQRSGWYGHTPQEGGPKGEPPYKVNLHIR